LTYVKTVWKNRIVERPRTYQLRDNGDDTVTLISAEGVVTEEGTPVDEITMNKIEDQISANDSAISSLVSRIDTNDSKDSAQDDAISGLDSRLDAVEDKNTDQDTAIGSLDTRLDLTESKNLSQDGDISSLITRVSSVEDANNTQDVTINSLDTRLDSVEGVNSTQDSEINSLDSRLTTLEGNSAETVPSLYENIENHKADTSNPHDVTASQVGAYTKTEADSRYATKGELSTTNSNVSSNANDIGALESRVDSLEASKMYILYYNRVNRSYSSGWNKVYFSYSRDKTNITSLGAYEIQFDRTGVVTINVGLSFGATDFAEGYALVDVVVDGERFRIGGTHYNQNGNFSVNGSISLKVNAGEVMSVEANCGEAFDIVAVSDEIRTYFSVVEN
jgi:hypothetical protein